MYAPSLGGLSGFDAFSERRAFTDKTNVIIWGSGGGGGEGAGVGMWGGVEISEKENLAQKLNVSI